MKSSYLEVLNDLPNQDTEWARDWSKITEVFDKEHGQNVVLVLRGINRPSEGITSRPDDVIKFFAGKLFLRH